MKTQVGLVLYRYVSTSDIIECFSKLPNYNHRIQADFSLYAPYVGRRHDLTFLRGGGIDESLLNCITIGGEQYYLFVDDYYIFIT